MNPRRPVLEVMKRTWTNFKFVDKYSKVEGPFEDVQLVNSFLGALVHVKEKYQQHIPKWKLPLKGWPPVRATPPFGDPPHLRALVRLLRHSIAHGNIEFTADAQNLINGVTLWNIDPKTGKTTWKADIVRDDLRKLLERFIKLMTPILKKYEPPIYD